MNLLLGLLVALLSVQGDIADPTHALLLKNGQVLHGSVSATTEDSVTFLLHKGDVAVTFHAAEIDRHYFYELRSMEIGDDAAAHAGLGKHALDEKMFALARLEFRQAASLDPSYASKLKADLAIADNGMAEDLLVSARKFLDEGEFFKARKLASQVLMRFPEGDVAKDAHAFFDLVAKKSDGHRQEEAKELAKLHSKIAKDESDKMLNPIQDLLARAEKLNQDGLANHEEGKRAFTAAGDEYKKALAGLDTIEKRHGDDERIAATVKSLQEQAEADGVQAFINLGQLYINQTAYPEAMKAANLALSIDPDSADAKAFQAQASSASTEEDNIGRYGWRLRATPVRRGARR